MNIVETCKCGASIRLVGSPASIALEAASFRSAHHVCRQPENYKPRDISDEAIAHAKAQVPILDRLWDAVSASNDDLPCPECGGDRLRPNFTGEGSRCHADSSALTTGRLDPNPDGEFLDGEQP